MKTHPHTSSGFPRRQAGFTLVEVLLALAIGTAAVFIASEGFLLIFKTNDRQEAALEVLGDGRDILFSLGKAVREADEVLSPLEGEEGSIMTLRQASTSITFEVGGGVLWMTVGAAEPIELSGKNVLVTNLVIERFLPSNTPALKIEMTVASRKSDAAGVAYRTETFTDSFVLRTY